MKTTRQEVYAALDGERAYQESVWAATEGEHSPAEWLVFMQDYLQEAMKIATREPTPISNGKVVHIIRKITAMGVCAMEQHGAPLRAKAEQP